MRSEDLESLASRLGRLESQNRALRRVVVGLVAAVGLAASVGFTGSQDGVVWGTRFVLVDATNEKRATLETGAGGAPVLTFYDEAGRRRVELGTFESGNGMLRLREADGSIRLQGSVTDAGSALRLYDGNETRLVEIEVAGEAPRLSLNDRTGAARTSAGGGDHPFVRVLDDDGEVVWEPVSR